MHGLPWHTSGSTVIRLLMIYLLHFGNCAWRASYTSFFNNNWETIIGDHGFLFHVQAAIFNSTFFPALVASVISMSRLNFSNLPRIRSETRDCEMPSTCAASACVHCLSRIRISRRHMSSERMVRMAASSGGNPRSMYTLPLDLVILSFSFFILHSP